MSIRVCLCLSFVVMSSAVAQSAHYRLHKFEQAIGDERDTIKAEGAYNILAANFSFTDRGTKVALQATLRTSNRGDQPAEFSIAGSTSRSSKIDITVNVRGETAEVKDGTKTSTVPAPGQFFTTAGYAPAAVQEALVLYWRNHGQPTQLPTLPSGTVKITARGTDVFQFDRQKHSFARYSVSGLVWGLETLWLDQDGHLAALVTRDAEFDHFEAVRETYEAGLEQFVATAAADEIKHLAELNGDLPGRKTGTLALIGGALLNVETGQTTTPGTIVVQAGKIAAIGPSDNVTVPADAQRIDIHGKYVIPGLWDMHAHYEQVEWGPIYLAAGVTTVRDVGNEFEFITQIRDGNNSGRGLGPHLLLAGVVDGDGPIALGVERVNTKADAARWVDRYHQARFEQMKIYSSVKPDIVKVICEQAHAAGMSVTGHIPEGMTIFDGIADGMDQVNHLQYVTRALLPAGVNLRTSSPEERAKAIAAVSPDSPQGQRLLALLKQRGTVIDDTTALSELMSGLAQAAEPGIQYLAPELKQTFESMSGTPESEARAHLQLQKSLDILRALHRAGIPVVAGTDQAVPGFSVYRQLELYVEAGWSPLEALQAATILPARVMKVSDAGSLKLGTRADLIVLDADPLKDIHNVRSVQAVVANGTYYDPAPLWKSVGFQSPRSSTAEESSEEAAVRSIVQQYLDARNHADEAKTRSLFTADADQLVSSGEWRRGRENLVKGAMASSRKETGTSTIRLDAVRFITADIAIADGDYETNSTTGSASARKMRTTFVLKREAGNWKIAAIRNMLPSPAAH